MMTMVGGLANILMSSYEVPDCYDVMGLVAVGMLASLMLNATLGITLCIYMAYLARRRTAQEFRRLYLGRCLLLTHTTKDKFLFALVHIMDAVGVLMLIIELAMLSRAKEHCDSNFLLFYELGLVLQFNVVIRLFLFCLHFKKCSRPFYKYLKRRFQFLSVIESEQRLVLDVWRLE